VRLFSFVTSNKNYSAVRKNIFRDELKKGDLFLLFHYVVDYHGVQMFDNEHLTLSNFNVYSAPGMGIRVEGRQHHWQFLHTRIKPRPGRKEQHLATTSDNMHFKEILGHAIMDHCEISFGGDDYLNFHEVPEIVWKKDVTGKRSIRDNGGFGKNGRVGDTVEFRNPDLSPTGIKARITTIRKNPEKGYDISFDSDLPIIEDEFLVAYNWGFNMEQVIIRNSWFHDGHTKGVTIKGRNITVENNRFTHTAYGGLVVSTGYTFDKWREGYCISNVVIRGNVFENSTMAPAKFNLNYSPVISLTMFMEKAHSVERTPYPIIQDVLIEKNLFRDAPGATAYFCSSKNVIFRDNRIINNREYLTRRPYRAAVYMKLVSDIKVVNNTWVRSPLVEIPGVIYDDKNSKHVTFEGNRLVNE